MSILRRPVAASEAISVAALPMYDLPELQAANDALWSSIVRSLAGEGIEAPGALTRGADLDRLWRDPALLLAQTCGYPLVTSLDGAVRLVATPRYRAPGCVGPFYRSAVIVAAASPAMRLADLRGGRCAVNQSASNSGMNLLRAEVARAAGGRAFFGEVRFTGAHLASLEAVASAQADVAAIDAVAFAHVRRWRPQLARQVRVLQWTQASPGLPLITSLSTPPDVVDALRRALDAACADPALADVRQTLLIDGFNVLRTSHYAAVRHAQDFAAQLAYPELR